MSTPYGDVKRLSSLLLGSETSSFVVLSKALSLRFEALFESASSVEAYHLFVA